MGGAEVSIRGQKVSVIGTADVNVTDRVARILGQLTNGVNVIDPRDRNWSLAFPTDLVDVSGSTISATISGTPDVNVTDRAARLLGITYGSQGAQLQQRAATFELLTQLTSAGVQVDPRDRNWTLSSVTDSVSATISGTPDVNVTDRAARLLGITYGSQGAQLQQRAATFELLTQLTSAGVQVDPRDRNWTLSSVTDSVSATISGTPDVNVTDRAARLLGITYGSQGQQLQQLAATFDLITRPYGSQGQQLMQDQSVTNLRVIETVHNRIHAGRVYEVTDVALNVNTATPKRYLLITPNTSTRIHMILLIESEPGITIEFFEDTTVSANGTGLDEINHNRTSANVAELTTFEDPTVTADGTILFTFRTGTSTAGGKAGGRVQREDEYVLKQNANYQLKITPISNNTNITADISWYEVV